MTTLTLHAEGKKLKALVSVLSALDIPYDKVETVKSPYNQEFIKKIQESELDKKEGRTRKISLDDVWK
jgi:hypothetical protein